MRFEELSASNKMNERQDAKDAKFGKKRRDREKI